MASPHGNRSAVLSWNAQVDPETHATGLSLAGSFYSAILQLFTKLVDHARTTPGLFGDQHRDLRFQYTNELHRLDLWGDGFEATNGHLDEILAKASRLRVTVLTLFLRLSRVLTADYVKLHAKLLTVFAAEIEEARRMEDKVSEVLHDSTSSPNFPDDVESISGSDTSGWGDQDILGDITCYIDCLMQLCAALENPAFDVLDEAAANEMETEIFNVSIPQASNYCRRIRDQYPKMPRFLVERFGEANATRYTRLSEMRKFALQSRHSVPQTDLQKPQYQSSEPPMSESLFSEGRPDPTDTTRSTSRSEGSLFDRANRFISADEDSVSIASFASYSTTISAREQGRPVVPPLPEATNEDGSFACPGCLATLHSISTRIAWKKHVYDDLQPYSCTFEDCESPHQAYRSTKQWAIHEMQHIEGNSKFQYTPGQSWDRRCPFCDPSASKLTGGDYFRHVHKHLREVALAVFPCAYGGDDDSSDGNGSDSNPPISLPSLNRTDTPPLAAILSEGVPDLGDRLNSTPRRFGGRITRRLSDASSHYSSIAVSDRGDEMYVRAYHGGFNSNLLGVGSTAADNAPLWNKLRELQCKSSDKRWFFPRGTIEHFFTLEVILQIIKMAKISPPLSRDEIEEYARKIKGTPMGGKSFIKILAILGMISRQQDIIRFVNLGINDSKLPLKAFTTDENLIELRESLDVPIEGLRNWPGNYHYQFDQEQWSVLTPWFSRRRRRHAPFYQLDENVILPWIYQYNAAVKGGFGEISRVEIHPNNHDFDIAKSHRGSFAIKQLKVEIGEDSNIDLEELKAEFQDEIEILNRFSAGKHPHLVTLLAAYRRGNECCLIFHWAQGNLHQLWKTVSHGSPLEERRLRWMLEQSRGIADGLRLIHVCRTSETSTDTDPPGSPAAGNKIYGRHGDIKPENILIFRNDNTRTTGNDPTGRKLVITDFGLSRSYSAKTSTYFPRSGPPVTPTYCPPECDLTGFPMSRSFDIWSLGCVLIEFITWYLGGWELVRKFVEYRKKVSPLLDYIRSDQFFEVVRTRDGTGTGEIYVRVKFEVQDFVNDLHAHKHCCEVVHQLLDFIMDKMLVVEAPNITQTRAKADYVCLKLDELCREVNTPDFTVIPAPREKKEPTVEPPAVQMPLSVIVHTAFSAGDRVSTLIEHKGQLVTDGGK